MGQKSTSRLSSLAVALASAGSVVAHGHITNVVINGLSYPGYDSPANNGNQSPPPTVGWIINAPDNGFVSPDAFGTADIICHKDAKPAPGHAVIAAGDKISLQWLVPWPDSHHGPVLDYLAACNGLCETVDKTQLEFFKIDESGYINGSNPGFWGDDVLVADNSTWLVQIPADLAPGNYVLRHEIIALHSAGNVNGAQAYPQCINLQVTGGGSNKPSGTPGTALYKETDPGILYNLYTSPEVYTIPGPALISGVPSTVAQSSSKITASASPIIPGSSSGVTTTGVISSVKTTSTGAVKTSSTFATTTKAATTSAPASGGSSQTKYGQCGGSGWTGPTVCASGSTCSVLNAYYAQCV